ncbi:uncharacterized protein LOC110424381 isoform X2 [Herrania umbratica]|uniref:Uncharacterized protein LOC110424381 isoform X2 n=1 Tax=Herrania umbratica TaxID=108875 RepID=A0A6J1B5K1_9ROSI|nr:uncharacterized protein LOC110424381 isoform X2 [Herrania umbratica]
MVEKNAGALSFNVGTNGVLRKRKSRSKSDGDLSDIDDAEITGYLNNNTEMLFKKMVWEAMNKDYRKDYEGICMLVPTNIKTGLATDSILASTYSNSPISYIYIYNIFFFFFFCQQKQKKPTMGKKSTSAKKAVASRMEKRKEEEKENKMRLSSKINYDALEKLSDEPEEVAEKTKTNSIDLNWGNQIDTQQSRGTSGTSGLEICGFEEDIFSDEVEPENCNLYSYGDGEEDGYGYREDYNYEEF